MAHACLAANARTLYRATIRSLAFRADHLDEGVAAFQALVADPANLSQSTAHPKGATPWDGTRQRASSPPNFHLFDFDNLFVADTSLFSAGCFRNPQLTTMALAHLAASRL